MIRITFICLSLFLACKTPQNLTQADIDAILKVLSMQEEAWNNGDIDSFMLGYWNNESLCFMGSNGLNKGWVTTKSRYEKSYPTKDIMGTLKFDIINMRPLGNQNYLLHGKYTLIRKNDMPSGYFTLVFEKINGEWLIISDHTS